MASIHVVIRKKKNKQGKFPIAVRITKNRKSSFIHTGQYIEEKDWDPIKQRVRKSHQNSRRMNAFIAKKLAEANDTLLDVEKEGSAATAQAITREITTERNVSTFSELAKEYVAQLEAKGKFSRLAAEKPRIRHFQAFLKSRRYKSITFSEISEVLLRHYQAWLAQERGNSERSIVNCLVVIRTLFNLAIREGIVDRKYYPFGKGGVVIRFPQSVKIGLTAEEVAQLEAVALEDPAEHHARNVWLFSFYFAGIRVSDVLKVKWGDIKDGRLHYQMGKNNKVLSLKVPDKARAILEQYEEGKGLPGGFIFPEMRKANWKDAKDVRRKVTNGARALNKYLGRVAQKIALDKPLTMHIARHTFGHISGDRIPVQVLQKLYRHSDITTTINYQRNFAYKEADDALDRVIGGGK